MVRLHFCISHLPIILCFIVTNEIKMHIDDCQVGKLTGGGSIRTFTSKRDDFICLANAGQSVFEAGSLDYSSYHHRQPDNIKIGEEP